MVTLERTQAQRIAEAAMNYEKLRTGHSPKSVTVVLSGETLVVTLHGALSPAERAIAVTPTGSADLQAYRRQLFESSAADFLKEIKDITGVEVREVAAEVEPTSGTVVTVFTTGTVVQVFLLANGVPTETYTGKGDSTSST